MVRRFTFLPKVLLLLLLVVGAWAAYATRDSWLPLINPNLAGNAFDRLPPDDRQAAEAAVNGAQAFFSFNSQTGKETWLAKLCEISTQTGCSLYKLGADKLWQSFGDQPFSIQAQAQAIKKVNEGKASGRKDAATQVWKVQMQLNQPLPGSDKTSDTAFVLVVVDQGVWKFERFLTPAEAERFTKE